MIDELIENPFPGLRPFNEDEDYLFFGRERQIDDLLKKLRQTRFLAVVGASGSGKSSLMKCGLFPSLYGGFMSGAGSNWEIITFRPGNNPIGNLAGAIAASTLFEEDEFDHHTNSMIIESTLRRGANGIAESIRTKNPSGEKNNYLILVDQFEELFRFNQREKNQNKPSRDARNFIDLLIQAFSQTDINIYISFTMRSEFLGDCTEFPGLPEAINRGQYLVPRLSREELKETILGPISVGGAEIATRLLNRLLNDVGEDPDQLPILQHALMRTWEHWRAVGSSELPIDVANYEAVGTMKHALSQHAEEAYEELTTKSQQLACERMFKALTEKNKKNQGIRRPIRLDRLMESTSSDLPTLTKIINIFRANGRSFLTPSEESELSAEVIIDISHESLMRVWERLIVWVDDEAESAGIYNNLCESAQLYQQGLTSRWVDPELQMAVNWRNKNSPNLTWAMRYNPTFELAMEFLAHCESEKELEIRKGEIQQQAKIRRARIYTSILTIAMIVMLIFAMISISLKFQAEENAHEAAASRQEALREKEIAQDQRLLAEEQKNIAQKERANALENEKLAEQRMIEAENQRGIANQERNRAVLQQQIAEKAKNVADEQRSIANNERLKAVHEKWIADSLKEVSEKAKVETARLRMLEISRKLAAYSITLNEEDSEIAPTLATLAHKFNQENAGYAYESVIFECLSKAAENEVIILSGNTYRSISGKEGSYVLDESGKVWRIDQEKKPELILPGSIKDARRIIGWKDRLAISNANQELVIVNLSTTARTFFSNVSHHFIQGGELNYIRNDRIHKLDPNSEGPGTQVIGLSSAKLVIPGVDNSIFLVDESDVLYQCNINSGKKEQLIQLDKGVCRIAYHEPRGVLAVAYRSGVIEVITMSGKIGSRKTNVHTSAVTSLDFSPEGQFLLSSSFDHTVRMINIEALEKEPTLIMEAGDWVWAAAFKDDQTVLAASNDMQLKALSISKDILASKICKNLHRDLTREEWDVLIGSDIKMEEVCTDKNSLK